MSDPKKDADAKDALDDADLEGVSGGGGVSGGDADDRPTEEVAFYYNKIAYAPTTDGIEAEHTPTISDRDSRGT